MAYPIAEKFISIQGEGLYTGTPMAFIRFVGCSVGKKICTACDTDFDAVYPNLGGGMLNIEEIAAFVDGQQHICFTGGEPLDRDLTGIVDGLVEQYDFRGMFHVETSGTRPLPQWVIDGLFAETVWLTVSPKPGYLKEVIERASEIKVILGGLGNNFIGWPTVGDAVKWADRTLVYIQPRNKVHTPDYDNLSEALEVVETHPTLRLSTQFHKFIQVR